MFTNVTEKSLIVISQLFRIAIGMSTRVIRASCSWKRQAGALAAASAAAMTRTLATTAPRAHAHLPARPFTEASLAEVSKHPFLIFF